MHKFTLKERQQMAGDWLLPDNLSRKLDVYCTQEGNGGYIRSVVRDGKIGEYLVTWLDFPEKVFRADSIRLSFRRPHNNECPPYVLIRIGGSPNE